MGNYTDLQTKVVRTGICTFCGACISACPQGFINSINGEPNWSAVRKEECTWCDKCYNACYMIRRELIKGLSRMIFGQSKKEEIGVYRRAFTARTTDEGVKRFCQDGGIVTSLLVYLLKEKLIDGVLVADREGWVPVASVAKTEEQMIRAAGTKYD